MVQLGVQSYWSHNFYWRCNISLPLQVNKDFGSIFSTLLPGATAKLAPPQGCGVLEGLEFKVALGTTWKENLSELSGGQRSGKKTKHLYCLSPVSTADNEVSLMLSVLLCFQITGGLVSYPGHAAVQTCSHLYLRWGRCCPGSVAHTEHWTDAAHTFQTFPGIVKHTHTFYYLH